MTWLRIDDGHEMHPKVASLSDSAHRLWSRAAGWCSRYGTNGFVPAKVLSDVALNKYSKRVLAKLANELVEAKAGGLYKVGLWEPVEGGWVFHDWHEYNPTLDRSDSCGETFTNGQASDAPRSRSEAARIAGKASAEARRNRNGSAQPMWQKSAETDGDTIDQPQDVTRTTFEDVRNESFERRSPNVSNVSELEPEPPDPVPRSRDLTVAAVAKDLSGNAGWRATQNPPQPQQRSSEPHRSESRPVSATPPSGLRRPPTVSDDHAEPRTQIPTSAVNVARIPTRAERARRDFDSMPIDELAKAFQANPTWVAESAPQARPELAHVAQAWDQAVGLPHRPLGHACRDDATSKLLGLYADGATFEQLLQACKQAGKDPWLCGRTGAVGSPEDKRKRRIDVLTPKVLRRLLDSAEADKPTNASPAVLRMLEQEKLRESGVLR